MDTLSSLSAIDAREWDALAVDGNPFVTHAFLSALEETGCVGAGTGWEPQHLVLRDVRARLLGAVPLYLKRHSYGEYVFDWAWARAYERSGLAYYPKLVAAIPFTPATGPRLLVRDGTDRPEIAGQLIRGALDLAREREASSLHWLFPTPIDRERLNACGFLTRHGVQFHWSNPGYRDFDDFLAAFTAEKRKKIKRERRRVQEAGVTIRVVTGHEASTADWDAVYRYYRMTIERHGAIPYLTRHFFHRLGQAMPSSVVLVLAHRHGRCVAAALNLRGPDTLYGRYWGGDPEIKDLHFETCYYRAIEYCIASGLARYEAGAQGEHKLARGFVPTPTYSAHWLAHPQFSRAVADFLEREQSDMAGYVDELNEHLPCRRQADDNSATADSSD